MDVASSAPDELQNNALCSLVDVTKRVPGYTGDHETSDETLLDLILSEHPNSRRRPELCPRWTPTRSGLRCHRRRLPAHRPSDWRRRRLGEGTRGWIHGRGLRIEGT